MSDLSNLLGDLYGEAEPDGTPVTREAPAEERTSWPSDDVDHDLAAALSAALADAPSPSTPVRPFESGTPATPAMPVLPDESSAPSLPTGMAAAEPSRLPPPPAPMAAVAAPVSAPPVAPVASWTSAPQPAPTPIALAAPVAPVAMWVRGDDDVFPSSGRARGKAAKPAKAPRSKKG